MNGAAIRCAFGLWIFAGACSDGRSVEPQASRTDAAPRADANVTPSPAPSASDAQTPRPDAQSAAMDARVPGSDAQPPREDASGRADAQLPAPDAATSSRADASAAPAAGGCKPRAVEGADGVRFHHVHFNSVTPEDDLAFYEKYFAAPPVDFCQGEAGAPPTRATRTDRGWFLYSKVAQPPDATLNAYLEHIGWIHPDPAAELQRLVQAGAPLFPPGRGQCETAVMGTAPCNNYWFYLQAPNGARVEVARGPGPATNGFGHVHMFMGTDYGWFETVTGGSLQNKSIDLVNHTDAALEESVILMLQVADTRGKPIDHIGYSTTNLEAEKERIVAAGIEIAEDISWKPEFGFRSFFLRSEKGVWVEIVEDSPFASGS